MGNDWNIPEPERPILESAVGGAVLDRLRNHRTTLIAQYLARGGEDAASQRVLESYEARLDATDYSRARRLLAADYGGDFDRAFASWNLTQHELARIERAVGAARIAAAEGTGGAVLDHYVRLGGDNPQTREALGKLAQGSAAHGDAGA